MAVMTRRWMSLQWGRGEGELRYSTFPFHPHLLEIISLQEGMNFVCRRTLDEGNVFLC